MVPTDSSLNRREFLKAGAVAAAGATLLPRAEAAGSLVPTATADACIWINLVGGPSQLDTFDPKPNAVSDVRGPFRPTRTKVPGMLLSELFPKMATVADKFSLIRSMNHTAAPIHETGFQLLQTGRLFGDGPEWPSMGAVVSYLNLNPPTIKPWWLLGAHQPNTGVSVSHGLGVGFLPPTCGYPGDDRPLTLPLDMWMEAATRIVGSGGKFVTINMFSTVFDSVSWDCHAAGGSLRTTLGDYRDSVAPLFDTAFASLLADLESRGLLERTLVVATGEFGRTPHLNANGGRDHWPACWTAILAGGGVQGGRIIGASDTIGSEPTNRPVSPQELVATVYRAMGIPANATIPGPDGSPVPVIEAAPVGELF